MENEEVKQEQTTSQETTAVALKTDDLQKESLEILNQVIAETDVEKTKDLTELFNINQKKKAMVRTNKMGELLDTLADQAIVRFTKKPDEITTQEIIQGLKTVQDIVERGQEQINREPDKPLIEVKKQEINIIDSGLSREARNKIAAAINAAVNHAKVENDVVEAEVVEEVKTEDEKHD